MKSASPAVDGAVPVFIEHQWPAAGYMWPNADPGRLAFSAVVLMSIATGLDGPSGASVVNDRFDSRFSGVHVTGTFGSLHRRRYICETFQFLRA